MITGGIGRLSSKRAHELGGEAFELREILLSKYKYEMNPNRLVVFSGLKTTGDNVDFLLNWIASSGSPTLQSFEIKLVFVEQSYLLKRVKVTIQGRLQTTFKSLVIITIFPIYMLLLFFYDS